MRTRRERARKDVRRRAVDDIASRAGSKLIVTNESRTQLNEFECAQALEFSRHYDNLLWLVTSLFTTANAALMAIAADKITPEIGLFGMGLSVLTVFFAANFRLLRRRVHAMLGANENAYRWLYSGLGGRAGQWHIFVLFYTAVALLWALLLSNERPAQRVYWWVAFAIASLVMLRLYITGRRHTVDAKEPGS
jgi:hypothetical protein